MLRFRYSHLLLAVLLLVNACERESNHPESATSNDSDSAQNRTPAVAERTPDDLRNASLNGQINIVEEALEQNVDVNDADQLDRTAVMFASYNGHTEIVRQLIAQGADIHASDSEGRTPLLFAASGPFPDTVELLLENGANPDVADSAEGWTALMFAAVEGNEEVVRILLDYGAEISLADDDGETAIDFAENNGHTSVVELLKENS